MPQKEDVLNNLSLLLDAILRELPPWPQAVIITAKRMASKWQEYPLLVLPDVNQFMNKKSLQSKITVTKIVAKQVIFWMEPQVPVWGHRNAAWLEPPILSVVNSHIFKI